MPKPIAIASVVVAAIALWVSCKDNDGPGGRPLVERTERQVAALVIGPEGGRLEADGVLVEIPPGALASPSAVTLTEVDDLATVRDLPVIARVLGRRGYVLGPPDLHLAKPASVTVAIGDDGATLAYDEAIVLFGADQRTNTWQPRGVSWTNNNPAIAPFDGSTNGPKLTAIVDHAQDLVVTAVKSTCFDHISCDESNPRSCTVRTASADVVRCTAFEPDRIACTCAGATDPVATLNALPPTAAAYGAVAMLCGASCTTPHSCMPSVSCFAGSMGTTSSGSEPPPDRTQQWNCWVNRAVGSQGSDTGEDLLCLLGDNRPPVPGGPLVTCTCSQSGPFPHPLTRSMPTNDQVMALWKEHCARGCP